MPSAYLEKLQQVRSKCGLGPSQVRRLYSRMLEREEGITFEFSGVCCEEFSRDGGGSVPTADQDRIHAIQIGHSLSFVLRVGRPQTKTRHDQETTVDQRILCLHRDRRIQSLNHVASCDYVQCKDTV